MIIYDLYYNSFQNRLKINADIQDRNFVIYSSLSQCPSKKIYLMFP